MAAERLVSDLTGRSQGEAGVAMLLPPPPAGQQTGRPKVKLDPSRADAERTMARLRAVLSEAELGVLLLSSVERLSDKEIGQVVRRSERAVHTILCRAREKARKVLAADDQREQ